MKTMKALGYWAVDGINVLFLTSEKDYRVYTEFSHGGRGAWSTVQIDKNGRHYFRRAGTKFYMEECMAIV